MVYRGDPCGRPRWAGARTAPTSKARDISLSLGAKSKRLRMKFQRRRDVAGEIHPIVPAGIEVIFVRDVASGEDFIERRCPAIEAIIILGAAIEINLKP